MNMILIVLLLLLVFGGGGGYYYGGPAVGGGIGGLLLVVLLVWLLMGRRLDANPERCSPRIRSSLISEYRDSALKSRGAISFVSTGNGVNLSWLSPSINGQIRPVPFHTRSIAPTSHVTAGRHWSPDTRPPLPPERAARPAPETSLATLSKGRHRPSLAAVAASLPAGGPRRMRKTGHLAPVGFVEDEQRSSRYGSVNTEQVPIQGQLP